MLNLNQGFSQYSGSIVLTKSNLNNSDFHAGTKDNLDLTQHIDQVI